MVHAEEGTLMAYLDGEIPGRDRSAIEVHLRECGPCATELDEIQAMASEFSAALARADGPIPLLRARARIERDRVAGKQARWFVARQADLLKAAAVVLLVAGAASAAIPGTPLRRLISTVVERTATLFQAEPTAVPVVQVPEPIPAPTAIEQRTPGPEAGISAAAAGGSARVSLHAPADGSRIAVRLVNGNTLRVIAAGSDETTFTIGANSIDAFQNSTGFTIEVPRRLLHLTIDVDGEVYFVKDGDNSGLTVSGTGSGSDEFVFQARSH